MTTTAPVNLVGRIDDLLNDAIRLLKSDSEATELYQFALTAWAARERDRQRGRRPRAPMSWLPNLHAIADWVGFR